MSATLTPEERERRILAKMAEIRQKKADQEIEQEAKRRLKHEEEAKRRLKQEEAKRRLTPEEVAKRRLKPGEIKKAFAWREYVVQHASQNGWVPFYGTLPRTDKVTGKCVKTEAYICPSGNPNVDRRMIIVSDKSIWLSLSYWNPKTQTGTKPELYQQFEAQYDQV